MSVQPYISTSTNVLNRKLEEVSGMTKEYDTIASLWARFHALVRTHNAPSADSFSESTNTTNAHSKGAGGLAASSSMREDESLVVPLHDQTILANPSMGFPGTGGYKLQVPPSARKGEEVVE